MTSVLRYSSYELMGRTTMFCVCFRLFVLVCFQRQELCRRYLYQQSMMSAEELEAARVALKNASWGLADSSAQLTM